MIDLLRRRLEAYQVDNALQTEQALKEILQEVALYALWRANFFDVAAFQGGTCLRIVHDLPRFSEDLDFILRASDPGFQWNSYFDVFADVLADFGIRCQLTDRGRMDQAVRQAMLKEDSIGRQLDMSFYRDGPIPSLKVKLEIDTRPPQGSGFDFRFLDFPLDFEICEQDLASNFALKIHALLCRRWIKGRDWFDFGWYVARGTLPNLCLLANALQQYGPWAGTHPEVDAKWLDREMNKKIRSIDWQKAAQDVAPFLPPAEQAGLKLWSERFLSHKLEKMTGGMDCPAGRADPRPE